MPAATATEWLTAAAIGTAAFIPGALLILSLDHRPHLPHLDIAPAVDAAAEAALWTRERLVALLLLLAGLLQPKKEATR